jgi:hypothetical protein
MTMTITNHEREAVGAFLSDVQHQRDIKRKFAAIAEKFNEAQLLQLVEKLRKSGILAADEAEYLAKKIATVYKSL